MTNPTIPPQQPEPERVCGNCQCFDRSQSVPAKGICEVHTILPPAIVIAEKWAIVQATQSCVLFRARRES